MSRTASHALGAARFKNDPGLLTLNLKSIRVYLP